MSASGGVLEEVVRFFREAVERARAGDVVEASEKLYKVAELCVRELAGFHGLPEYAESKRRGRWTTKLLETAVDRLADIYGVEVRDSWDAAYRLHVEGFHEGRLPLEEFWALAPRVECLVRILLGEQRGGVPAG